MAHPLDGCRAKLDWAEKHMNALSEVIETFVQSDMQTFRTEFDELDQSHVMVFEETEKIPVDWGLALGDVVHNTRSALDHLVYQLVLLAEATPHKSHQFPIVDHPNDWEGKVVKPLQQKRRGQLDFIDPTQVAIIQSLQPYVPASGVPRLAMLRRFSNTDKHRLIHAARASVTASPDITAVLSFPSTITDLRFPKPGTSVEDGAELARFRSHTDLAIPPAAADGTIPTPANAEMNVEAQFNMTTVFGEPGAEDTRGREFRNAISDVRVIVERFAADF